MYFDAGKMHRSFASLRMTSERVQAATFQITAHLFDAPPWQAAEKLLSKGVILSEAKDLLFSRAENKANPSAPLCSASG
jgi:hypothetical protein